MRAEPNENSVGMPTPTSNRDCAPPSIGTSPIAPRPKRRRRTDVNFPPPQVPPPLPPRATTRRPAQRREPFRRTRRRRNSDIVVTNALIATNLGIYVWTLLGQFAGSSIRGQLTNVTERLVISRYFIDNGEWYRLVSSGFVHFGILHVALNMYLLYQLGRLLEPTLGSLTFGLLYGASLLGGSAGALLLSPNALTGGASGAVFGIMAAAVVGMRERGVNPLQTGLGMTFLINIVFTLAIPGISVGGHFGGALAGAICGAVVLAPARWRVPRFAHVVVPVVVGACCVLIAVTPSL